MPNHPVTNLTAAAAALRPILAKYGQSDLSAMLNPRDSPLSVESRARLAGDLEGVDWSAVKAMRAMLAEHLAGSTPSLGAVEPAPMLELTGQSWPFRRHLDSEAAEGVGKQLFADGKVGFLLLAGGQGTRLGFNAPKGLYPILDRIPIQANTSTADTRTLFAFLAAGVASGRDRDGNTPALALMTSPDTHDATEHAFDHHGHFGLTPDRVRMFQQGTLPAMDAEGRLLVTPDGGLALAPDGHGGAVGGLLRSGTLEWFESLGCEWLVTFQVDNAAVRVADPGFIGLAAMRGADVGLKVVRKTAPAERVGVVATRGGKPAIVEYSELTKDQSELRLADGSLAHKAGSIAFNVFRLSLVSRVAHAAESDQSVMPLHLAHKKVPCIGLDGFPHAPSAPNAYKFERFIFDMLPHAKDVFALEVAREREFLPVKDADGPNSPAAVGQAMAAEWQRCMENAATPHQPLTPAAWHGRWG